MDPMHWVLLGISGLSVVAAVALGVAWAGQRANAKRAIEDIDSLQADLGSAQAAREGLVVAQAEDREKLSSARQSLQSGQEGLVAAESRLKVAEHAKAIADAEIEALEKRLRSNTESHGRVAGLLSEARSALAVNQVELDELRAKVAAEQAVAKQHRERLTAFLSALDVPSEPRGHAATSGRYRASTQHHLNDLKASTDAHAAAVVGRRGFALLGIGLEPSLGRLSRLGAVIAQSEPALEAVMGQAVTEASAVDPAGGLHVFRLLGDEYLALAGPVQAPTLAMRITSARISGRMAGAVKTLRPPVRAVRVGESRELELLADWAMRWKVRAVALVAADGSAPLSSDAAHASALASVGQDLRSWWRREERDGVDVGSCELRLRSVCDAFLAARPVVNDASGLIAVATSDAVIGTDAMDELCAMVRWRRISTPNPADSLPAEVAS
ncbi:MAG: hypothetical protein AB8H79_19305 [Myxococcota bacterium]